MLLDSNGHDSPLIKKEWEILVAVGVADQLALPAGAALEALKDWQAEKQDWLFGGFGYDLKNETERLSSAHPDYVGFPDLVFFQPEIVVGIRGALIEIQSLTTSPALVFAAIESAIRPKVIQAPPPVLRPRMSKAEYLQKVAVIRDHIVEGDLYEMNFCQEFYADHAHIDPVGVWEKLNALSQAPMAAFFRWHDRYLLSASPERFLKKEGETLISQPIKGTRRRAQGEDEVMRHALASSEKDRAENVMIVDLVRNDLARSCRPGTVKVPELFGIYTFETVHQMISTVVGELRSGQHPLDALRHAFPPGSMTGAPKVMAMTLIEQYERSRRGLYAGALGYLSPDGDFDFNVLIRSIFYNAEAAYVAFQVGGAIVYDSVPEEEYEECLVKAVALFAALG
jgi:para-aminobenzoate synthetase component 1